MKIGKHVSARLSSIRVIAVNKKIIVGLSIFLFFIIAALFAPLKAPYNVMQIGMFEKNLPPSSSHPLGTDIYGRDIADQLIVGLRNSLLIGMLAGAAGTVIGLIFGLLAGYKGGLTDHIIRSVTDSFLVVPTWPLLILIAAYLRTLSITDMALIIAAFSWPWSTRTIRAQTLSWKEREFVKLAKVNNLSDFEIAFREILPNMLPYIGVIFGSSVTSAMATEAALELIGIGPTNISTLGRILQQSFYFGALARGMYWWFFPPVICLIAIFISLQLINMGLDEVYNPRLKKITGM